MPCWSSSFSFPKSSHVYGSTMPAANAALRCRRLLQPLWTREAITDVGMEFMELQPRFRVSKIYESPTVYAQLPSSPRMSLLYCWQYYASWYMNFFISIRNWDWTRTCRVLLSHCFRKFIALKSTKKKQCSGEMHLANFNKPKRFPVFFSFPFNRNCK